VTPYSMAKVTKNGVPRRWANLKIASVQKKFNPGATGQQAIGFDIFNTSATKFPANSTIYRNLKEGVDLTLEI